MIHVFIPSQMRDLTGGAALAEVEGATVRQVIKALEARYPGVRDRLCAGDELRPGLSVSVNGTVSRLGLLQKLPDGAEVHFLPAIGGG
jgi:sulfur-carrier protein